MTIYFYIGIFFAARFVLCGTIYSRMDQVKFVEGSLKKIRSDIIGLNKPHQLKVYERFPRRKWNI